MRFPDHCRGGALTASLVRVKSLSAAASRAMAVGVLSAGWYSILTGAVLLWLAYVLGMTPWDVDRAAPFVSVAFAAMGLWQLKRGLRAEFERRPESTTR